MGTSPLPGGTATDEPIGTKLGFGVRAAFFNGRANPRLERLIAQIETIDDEVFDLMNKEDTLRKEVEATPGDKKRAAEHAALLKQIAETRARTESLDIMARHGEAGHDV